MTEKVGKNIKLFSKTLGNYMKSPVSIISDILRFTGYGIKESAQKPLVVITIIE